MKGHKFLWAIIVILAVGLIAETGYLLTSRKQTSGEAFAVTSEETDKSSFKEESIFSEEWEPWKEMERLRREIDSMFKDTFNKQWFDGESGLAGRQPPMDVDLDIRDVGSAYIVEADLPGMNKANINVEVKNNRLKISGERKKVEEEKTKKYFQRERMFGKFSTSMLLPDDAQGQGIRADYKKGILTVRIPKASGQHPEPARKIEVN